MKAILIAVATASLCFSLSAAAEVTSLSKSAASIKMGMSRSNIIAKLGPADFVVHSADAGDSAQELRDFAPGVLLELYWKNGKCGPVVVQFNANSKATGWDEGRAICLEKEYSYLPDSQYGCTNSTHSNLCR